MPNNTQKTVSSLLDTAKKELPKFIENNKGAAIGAVVGYLLADKLTQNEGAISAVLGGLVGKTVDDSKKESK